MPSARHLVREKFIDDLERKGGELLLSGCQPLQKDSGSPAVRSNCVRRQPPGRSHVFCEVSDKFRTRIFRNPISCQSTVKSEPFPSDPWKTRGRCFARFPSPVRPAIARPALSGFPNLVAFHIPKTCKLH